MSLFSPFLQLLNDMCDELATLPIQGSLKVKVQSLLEAVGSHGKDLSEIQAEYQQVVNDYLDAKPPFDWYKNPHSLSDKNALKADIRQYQILIKYSLFANDTRILQKWGINYSGSPRGLGLSSLAEHRERLAWIRDHKASAILKPYYTYLIDRLI